MARLSKTQAVRELVAVNEALAAKLGEVIRDAEEADAKWRKACETSGQQYQKILEEVRAELAEAVEAKDAWYKRWRRDQDLVTEANKRAASSDLDRREAEARAQAAEGERDKAVAGRNEARVYADMMRRQAFPDRPRFPWERPGMSDNRY